MKSKVLMGIAVGALISFNSLNCQPAKSQEQPNVSVVNLTVQQGQNGQQLVLTPRGYLVPLPGAGVNSNVVQIYMGSTGGYWYTDRSGQTVDLTAYVQQLRAKMGQAQAQQSAPPQYAPYAYAPQAPVQYTQQTTNNNNSGSNGAVAAAAIGAGAMIGTSIANAAYYNNVPYGTPMYYGANGRPYYNDENGKNVFVNDDGQVKWNNVYAANQIQNNRQEQQLQQANAYRQNEQASRQAAYSSAAAQQQQAAQPSQFNRRDYDAQQHQNFQQQQQWYQNQTQDRARAQSWQQQSQGENPFVRQGDNRGEQAGGFGGREQRQAEGGFAGAREQRQAEGGFGSRREERQAGGRFSGRDGGARRNR